MGLNLVLLKKQYLEFLRKTRNDPRIAEHLFIDVHITKEAQQKWYAQCYSKDETYLIFIAIDGSLLVGYGQITHIDSINRSCELGFCIAPEFHGNGYGKILVDHLVEYAFEELEMHRVYLEVFAINVRAQDIYEKCRFKREGVLRDKILKNDRFRDVLIMSIIKRDEQ